MSLRVQPDYGRVSAASEMNVRVTGEPVCLTTDCQAKGLRLTFSNLSRQQVQMRILPASISAGARTFDIPATDLPRGIEAMPQGPFLTTLVPARFVEALATEQDVKVHFGSTTFTFAHSDRAPLRALAATLQAGE